MVAVTSPILLPVMLGLVVIIIIGLCYFLLWLCCCWKHPKQQEQQLDSKTSSMNDNHRDDSGDNKRAFVSVVCFLIGISIPIYLVASDDILESPWLKIPLVSLLYYMAVGLSPMVVPYFGIGVIFGFPKQNNDPQNKNDIIDERITKTRFYVLLSFLFIYTICDLQLFPVFMNLSWNPFLLLLVFSLVMVASVAVAYFGVWALFGVSLSFLQLREQQRERKKQNKKYENESEYGLMVLFMFIVSHAMMCFLIVSLEYTGDLHLFMILLLVYLLMGASLTIMVSVINRVIPGLPLFQE